MFFNFFYMAFETLWEGVLYFFLFFLVISSDLPLRGLNSTFHILAQNLMLLRSMFNSAATRSIWWTTLYSMVSPAKSLMLVRIYFTVFCILYSTFCSEYSYTILPCYMCLYIMKTSVWWEKGEKVASIIVFYYYVKMLIFNNMFLFV